MRTRGVWCFVATLAAFFAYTVTPIWDSDFWWHLASGRWIVEHGTLPNIDPFGVFTAFDVVRNDTVLHGQWLGQIILYSIYSTFGIPGIIVLRAAILTACLGLLAWRAWRLGAVAWATWLVFIPSGLIMLGFTSDRPQLFSYLFAALVFMCLERYAAGGVRHWLIPIPIIGFLWSNTHAAYLLAIALLALYLVVEWLAARASRRVLGSRNYWIALTAIAFLAATSLNPNGLTTYAYLFALEGTPLQLATSEYRSALVLYQYGIYAPQAWVLVIYALTGVACFGLYRKDAARAALVVFLVAISAWSYRYFAFLVFVAGPYIAVGLGRVFERIRETTALKYTDVALAVGALLMTVVGYSKGWALRTGVNHAMFPVEATDAVIKQGLRGKVFNHMQWGGYLLWAAPPGLRIYIDGRMLDSARYEPYTHILWATPAGQMLLEHEQFNIVMTPTHNRFTGERYALVDYLNSRPDWNLVYTDFEANVFMKR